MAIQWGLAQQPNAFERAFAQGQQATMQQRAMQREEEARNALASYAMKPNEAGFNALAQAAPEIAIQVQGQRQQAAQAAAERDIRARAFAGDPAARSELAGFDINAARGLTSDQRERMNNLAEVSANVAQMVLNLPEAQQAGAWREQMQILSQRGYPELAAYADQYSPEYARSTIAEAGQWRQFSQDQQPDTVSVTAGGSVVQIDKNGVVSPLVVPNYNGAPIGAPAGPAPAQPQTAAPTQIRVTPREYSALTQRYGPDAVQQRMANGQVIVTVQTPDEARTLPSGTRILLPDGTEGRVP